MKCYVFAIDCTCGGICQTGGVNCQRKGIEEAEGMVGSDEKEVRNS